MSFLIELINSENDEALKEELQDRVDIIAHKIKFIDQIPVICLTTENEIYDLLHHLIKLAGGNIVALPEEAKVVIYAEQLQNIAQLISKVSNKLSSDWAAVKFNRIYLMDSTLDSPKNPSAWVSTLEDLAEMIHPGFFVFGNEGRSWVNFSVS